MSEILQPFCRESDDHNYGRISVDIATKFSRNEDGLPPGQIALSRDLDVLPDDVRPILLTSFPTQSEHIEHVMEEESLVDFRGMVSDWHLDNYGHVPQDTYDQYFRVFTDLDILIAVGEVVAHAQTLGTTDEDPQGTNRKREKQLLDEQYISLLGLVNEFTDNYPEAELAIDQPGSVNGLSAFVKYYKQRVYESVGCDAIIDMLESHRQSLVTAMETSKMQRHLGKANALRIARHISDQPLVLADPLLTILYFEKSATEPLGWFSSAQRISYLDILTTRSSAKPVGEVGNTPDDMSPAPSDRMDLSLLTTMAHEFLHAATNDVYRLSGEVSNPLVPGLTEPTSIVSRDIWPEFVYEAMVEKAAYLMAVTARPELFEKVKNVQRKSTYENDIRVYRSDNPTEILAPKYMPEIRSIMPSSYVSYRILMDTVMEKADWARAGFTRKQADKMMIDAFFSRTDDMVSQDTKARKRFMKALHQATHKGFLVKIGQLVDIYGTDQVLDMLESPRFDPTNPEDLQIIATPRVRARLQRLADQRDEFSNNLQLAKDAGAPDVVLQNYEIKVDRREQAVKDLQLLNLATKGLAAVMDDKYGVRNRSITPVDRIHRSVFGQLQKTTFKPVEVKNLPTHKAAIRNWKNLVATHEDI